MLGRLPISSCGSKAACFSLTRLEGQYHQKHLLELGVWGLEVVLVLPMAPIPPPSAGFFGPAPHVFLPQLCFCQVLSIRGERAPLPALAQVPGPLRQPALSVLNWDSFLNPVPEVPWAYGGRGRGGSFQGGRIGPPHDGPACPRELGSLGTAPGCGRLSSPRSGTGAP